MGALFGLFSWALTPAGLVALATLDSSAVFFLPFAIDGVVVYLAARDPERAWLWPTLAVVGGVIGATISWWIGRAIDEHALERLISEERLERARRRAEGGVWAPAALAIVPPPFPYTAYEVAAGALGLDLARFLAVFAGARAIRFGLEAALARRYGDAVLAALESRLAHLLIGSFIGLALAGTAWGTWRLFRHD